MSEISKVSNQNSNLRILLARTTNKLLQIFIHKKTLFTMNFTYNDPVYHKIHSEKY